MVSINNNSENIALSRRLMADKNNFNALILKRTSKQIDKPHGKLVPSTDPITGAAVAIKDTVKDAKNLVNAIKNGKSNDHELGRMNDLGLKIGGLSIAAYLLTRRTTRTTKFMEFAGFGTFIGAMALWPKLFIQAPLKSRFGFDINQKYQDSQGRKKSFFQDNQYLPWDLWSSKKLNKIGDQMGVDKNMKDREEFIKKKMQTVALQGNTLWMLTAGFATPLMSSLMCNRIEKVAEKHNVKKTMENAEKAFKAFDESSFEKIMNSNFDAENKVKLKKLLTQYEGKEPDAKFFEAAKKLISPATVFQKDPDIDSLKVLADFSIDKTEKKIIEELKGIMAPKATVMNAETVDELAEKISKILTGAPVMDPMGDIVPGKQLSIDDAKAIFHPFVSSENKTEFSFKNFMTRLSSKGFAPDVEDIELNKKLKEIVNSAAPKLDWQKASAGVEELYKESVKTKATFKVFEEFVNSFAGKKAESYYTQVYKGIANKFMHELSPKYADLNAARKSSKASEEIVTRILGNIAEGVGDDQEKTSYKYFAKIFGAVEDKINNGAEDCFVEKMKHIENLTKEAPKSVALADFNAQLKPVLSGFVETSKAGVDNTALRIIMALDLEKRIKDPKMAAQIKNNPELGKITEIAKHLIYNATPISIQECNGIQNMELYEKTLKFLFKDDMDKTILESLVLDTKNSSILDRLSDARKQMFEIYFQPTKANLPSGAAEQYSKVVTSKIFTNNSPSLRYGVVGKPITDLFKEAAGQQYNDKTWMRCFGGASILLVAVTLISQMFFGKIKDEKYYTAKGGNNASK